MNRYVVFLLLVFGAANSIHPSLLWGEGGRDQWREIIRSQEEERHIFSSLQFDYATSVLRTLGEGAGKIENRMYFRMQGEMFYSKTEMRDGDEGDRKVRVSEMAYDGNYLRRRDVGDADRGYLAQTRRESRWSLSTPLPWDVLTPNTADAIESAIVSGRLTLDSLTQSEAGLVEVVFVYSDTGQVAIRTHYDAQRGYIPVSTQEYSESGDLLASVHDVVVKEFEINGNSYFLPVSGVHERYLDREVIYYRDFSVDTDSVVIDEIIPVEDFRLKAEPGEPVYDSDLSCFLSESDGAIDQIGLDPEELDSIGSSVDGRSAGKVDVIEQSGLNEYAEGGRENSAVTPPPRQKRRYYNNIYIWIGFILLVCVGCVMALRLLGAEKR